MRMSSRSPKSALRRKQRLACRYTSVRGRSPFVGGCSQWRQPQRRRHRPGHEQMDTLPPPPPTALLTSCPQMLEGFSTSTIAAGARQAPVCLLRPLAGCGTDSLGAQGIYLQVTESGGVQRRVRPGLSARLTSLLAHPCRPQPVCSRLLFLIALPVVWSIRTALPAAAAKALAGAPAPRSAAPPVHAAPDPPVHAAPDPSQFKDADHR